MRYIVFIFLISIIGLSPIIMNASSLESEGEVDTQTRSTEPPEIDIEITSTDHRANVAPGEDGIVTIFGKVTANINWTPNVQYMAVNLTAKAGDWRVSDIPELTFTHREQLFSVTVEVPPLINPDRSRDLIITGEWYYNPRSEGNGTIETEYVHIKVMPFVHLEMDLDAENRSLYLDESGIFKATIINKGTMTARVDLQCTSDSWEVDFILSEDHLEILPDQSREVEVKFKQSSGSKRSHTITLTAIDSNSTSQGPINGSFTLTTKEKTFLDKARPFIVSGIFMFFLLLILTAIVIVYKGWRDSKLRK